MRTSIVLCTKMASADFIGRVLEVLRGRAATESGPAAKSRSGAEPSSATTINRILTILFGLCAGLFFILAVIGTVHNYSPVPFWDMWDDYLGFYLRAHAGMWDAWWAPHNEHRIVLARLFFWIDIKYFHGNGIFSLVVIYVFALAVGLIFAKIWKEQSDGQDLYILFFVEAWIFCWIQKENLTWAFQSQFILAQLLPLAALYFLHLSLARPNKKEIYFAAATICGILAVGSMANGVLALPAMALYAVMTRTLRRATFFVALSVIEIVFYFQNFNTASPRLTGEITGHIWGFIEFFLRYLGGPFIALIGFKHGAIVIGEFAGAILVLISAVALVANLRRAERPSLPLALVTFILYIMATAAITAVGRLSFGLHEALASRYQTPALYVWAAALLLYWPPVAKSVQIRNVVSFFLAALLFCVMLPRQVQALAMQREMQYQRELGALALELQIHDDDRIREVDPRTKLVLEIADQARQQHLSIFGIPPLGDANLILGQKIKTGLSRQCPGHMDLFHVIPDAPGDVRVDGWLYDGKPVTTPKRVLLINQSGEILGIGLLGAWRADVAHAYGRKASYSGFEAYLSAKANGQRIAILGPGDACHSPFMVARFN